MINRPALLNDLQDLLVKLHEDLRTRCAERPEVETPLRAQYDAARAAKRTAESYESWREDQFAQATVAWILSCVFIRFLEDNGLLGDTAYLSGPGPRLALARDQRTLYFRQHPTESDREYLYHVFRAVRGLPGMAPLFDDTHNPVWRLGLSGDGAQLLLEFWQKLNAEEGQDQTHAPLVHDFSDPNLETRFLGDLYQDLSDEAKKRYALLQTPEFIEEFILDRTLTPAIETFGYQHVRMIDPTCGSAHFLLGGFHRLFALHQRNHPAVEVRALAQRALDQVFGVDLNPNVVAIARFRLLLAALKVSGVDKLKDAPAFQINVGTGDTLLHGPGQAYLPGTMGDVQHHYESEDADLVRHILGQRYHAVVGNPPYITVKDKALNLLYRERFGSCHRKYSLAVPFMEVFFALAVKAEQNPPTQAGYVGMITANSFMKREFGKKLIEEYIPHWDMTHVIDTSGAYIPGHGTPTVILFGRNQAPIAPTIRTVMGIKGEPTTPDDPAHGLVWEAILSQVDHEGAQSDYVSTADTPREKFHRHPWSIGGGGAAELKEVLEEQANSILESQVEEVGRTTHTGEDEAFYLAPSAAKTYGLLDESIALAVGEEVRDWTLTTSQCAIFPYDKRSASVLTKVSEPLRKRFWGLRTVLRNRSDFGNFIEDRGLKWFEHSMFFPGRFLNRFSISFAEVASHNHFVFDRGGRVFSQTAPAIKLKAGATEDDHLILAGYLNSSLVCFWIKQVAHQKQMTGGDGIRIESRAKVPYQLSGTQLLKLPLPIAFLNGPLRARLGSLSRLGDETARRLQSLSPENAIAEALSTSTNIEMVWERFREERQRNRSRLIFLQEQIDFVVYAMFGLADRSVIGEEVDTTNFSLEAGQRPFEILLGKNEDDFPAISQVPVVWPEAVKRVWNVRLEVVKGSSDLRLIEDAHYKRRWIGRQGLFNHSARANELKGALGEWLLNRLEDPRYWPEVELTSCAHLADKVRRDTEFMTVANLYRNRPDYDLTELVVELVELEAVPFLPVLRYKPSGLRKREVWEQTWAKQREEDAIDARTQLPEGDPNRLSAMEAKTLKQQQIGDIPVPPKYDTKDFLETTFWRLRGKLDVPKERFLVYPHCNRDADRTPVIGWAGWDHLQQAQAVAGYYERMRTNEGWSDERLLPLLAGVLELLPWLLQWHNALDPQYGMGLGDFFRSFAEEEARRMGKTLDEVRAWQPPEKSGRRKKGNTAI